jgi:hypothetical protein
MEPTVAPTIVKKTDPRTISFTRRHGEVKSHVRILGVTSLGFALACAEMSNPVEPGVDGLVPHTTSGSGNTSSDIEGHVLETAVQAPSLEAYFGQFWAVAGREQTFRLRYASSWGEDDGDDDDAPTFWRLRLGKHTLVTMPDGTRLDYGDSLLVTVTVDPNLLVVDMEPSGLQFNPMAPAELTLFYGYANPDLNRDGYVDGEDGDIESNLLGIWFRADQQSAWESVTAWHDRERQRFRLWIGHFSGYTVSW